MAAQSLDMDLHSVDVLIERLCDLGGDEAHAAGKRESTGGRPAPGDPIVAEGSGTRRSQGTIEKAFVPPSPVSLAQAKLSDAFVEVLLLKILLYGGRSTGAEIARRIALPFHLVEQLLQRLKNNRLIEIKGTASVKDYFYELTDLGTQQARRHMEQCAYGGAAPVALEDYVDSVNAQSPQKAERNSEILRRAFEGLEISDEMFFRIGRAVLSGKGLFLHGAAGNGKTSIAERISRAFGSSIWIPRAIIAADQIVRVFDPTCHEELPRNDDDLFMNSEKCDRRWVHIRRPTIIVGGELRMESLDIAPHQAPGSSEAPVQVKSNCGILVIDDFGRQQISPTALLNRWIVPLEKRHDYLNLPSGSKMQVPFEQFVIFSTNLEPASLVDEAFLRRIPFKIDVANPTEKQFRRLFTVTAEGLGISQTEEMLDYLITRHYHAPGRDFRFCHPRDLLDHVAVYCDFLGIPRVLSVEALDAAAGDYFAAQ